jgi:hypothetical protein
MALLDPELVKLRDLQLERFGNSYTYTRGAGGGAALSIVAVPDSSARVEDLGRNGIVRLWLKPSSIGGQPAKGDRVDVASGGAIPAGQYRVTDFRVERDDWVAVELAWVRT